MGFVTDEVRKGFKPVLSHESLDAQWLGIKAVAKAEDVHPRLEELFDGDNKKALEDILHFEI